MSVQTCNALIVNGKSQDRGEVPVPKPGPHQLLVRVSYAAQNPTDACTSWLALFSKDFLNLDRTNISGTQILIWGGSSSVGLYAIQIAAIYGMEIITTCGSQHHNHVRALGAQHVFDYRDKQAMSEMRAVAKYVRHVFDTIGNADTSTAASELIHPDGGALCTVRPGNDQSFTENVTPQTRVTDVLVWTELLKDHAYKSFFWPASTDDHRLSAELFECLPEWLCGGNIKPYETKVYDGGLDDVTKGFQEYCDGKISGYKIVYKL